MENRTVWINPKIEVRRSGLHGFGVFARENIDAGEVLERAHCVRMPRDQFNRIEFINQHLGGYFFSWPKEDGDQAALIFGFGSIYNHADDPNADWDADTQRGVYVFTAIKDIAADDEICVSYGENWWQVRKHTIHEEGPR